MLVSVSRQKSQSKTDDTTNSKSLVWPKLHYVYTVNVVTHVCIHSLCEPVFVYFVWEPIFLCLSLPYESFICFSSADSSFILAQLLSLSVATFNIIAISIINIINILHILAIVLLLSLLFYYDESNWFCLARTCPGRFVVCVQQKH